MIVSLGSAFYSSASAFYSGESVTDSSAGKSDSSEGKLDSSAAVCHSGAKSGVNVNYGCIQRVPNADCIQQLLCDKNEWLLFVFSVFSVPSVAIILEPI